MGGQRYHQAFRFLHVPQEMRVLRGHMVDTNDRRYGHIQAAYCAYSDTGDTSIDWRTYPPARGR